MSKPPPKAVDIVGQIDFLSEERCKTGFASEKPAASAWCSFPDAECGACTPRRAGGVIFLFLLISDPLSSTGAGDVASTVGQGLMKM